MSTVTYIPYFKDTDEYTAYAPNETIFTVGAPDDVLYYVIEGEVELQFAGKTLETVTEGGIFGEKSLIDDNPHTTSAIAKTSCKIARVDEQKFLFLVHETPTFALTVMRTMAQRTRHIMELALQ